MLGVVCRLDVACPRRLNESAEIVVLELSWTSWPNA